MKILFLSNIPSPYRVDFFNELGKLCDLTVCFEGESATNRNSQWKNDGERNYKEICLNGIRTASDKFFSLKVLKILNQKWDHIILGGYATPTLMLAILYLKARKKPFILEADGGRISSESQYKYKFKKFFISSASAWMSTGKTTTDYFIHYGAKKESCFVYPFTSLWQKDLDKAESLRRTVSKKEIRKKLGMSEEKIVLSVGRFTYDRGYGKGYDFIMNAAEKTKDKDIGYYIVGDEPTEEFVKWKEEKELEHIHFVGFKKKDELADYYIAADLFVLMTRGDIWGLVINEAMSYGLPIISTTTCVAACELITDGESGYIIDLDEAKQLEEYVRRLLQDEETHARFAEASLEEIKKYTIEKMAQAHVKILEKR